MFLQQIVNGISLGGVYALIALGYTMVYGIGKMINFAHGDILMVGAYAAFFVLAGSAVVNPLAFVLALLIGMIICAILGVVIEKTCYKPLRSAPRINVLITAIGVSYLLENGTRVIPFIGPNYRQFPTFENTVYHFFGGVSISLVQMLVFCTSILLMVMLTILINFTKIGKAMRATSFDFDTALMMGININLIISFTFAIGAALGAAAGVLSAAAYPMIDPLMGFQPGLKAFVAAVLGGIGSVPGAMLGGFSLAIAETLTKGFISSKLADGVSFGILIIVLVIKPSGILGAKIREKV